MVALLQNLFDHLIWADDAILSAIRANPDIFKDEEVRKLLHHIAVVQRFFVRYLAGHEFDTAEMKVPETFEAMESYFREAHEWGRACYANAQESQLGEVFERPPLEKMKPSRQTMLMQVIMHSQG